VYPSDTELRAIKQNKAFPKTDFAIFQSIMQVRATSLVLPCMNSLRHQGGTIADRLRLRTTYLPATEVMEILGVDRATLCAWVRSGTIEAVRIGKNNKFDPVTLSNWIDARTRSNLRIICTIGDG
jgi:hypothetical protein